LHVRKEWQNNMIIGTALIVCTWLFFFGWGFPLHACIIVTVLSSFLILFGMTFGIYFFNLDMKIAAKSQPLLDKLFYDKRKRNKEI